MLFVPDQCVQGPVFPATKNFREVICFPEVGKLTLEARVVVVKVSSRRCSNTNGFNNQYIVQCSNPVLERSAAETLIVTRPVATAKYSACRKNSSASQLN